MANFPSPDTYSAWQRTKNYPKTASPYNPNTLTPDEEKAYRALIKLRMQQASDPQGAYDKYEGIDNPMVRMQLGQERMGQLKGNMEGVMGLLNMSNQGIQQQNQNNLAAEQFAREGDLQDYQMQQQTLEQQAQGQAMFSEIANNAVTELRDKNSPFYGSPRKYAKFQAKTSGVDEESLYQSIKEFSPKYTPKKEKKKKETEAKNSWINTLFGTMGGRPI